MSKAFSDKLVKHQMYKLLSILLIFILSGCASKWPNSHFLEISQKQYFKEKWPNGFCALAVSQTYLRLYQKYPDNWYHNYPSFQCRATSEEAQKVALDRCNYCEIAYVSSIAENKIIQSFENYHLNRIQITQQQSEQEKQNIVNRRINNFSEQCTSFGFTQATTAHSNCIMQLEIAGNLSAQMKESSDAQTQEMQKIRQQQALDSLNQSLKNLNRPANKPSVTCNRTFTGFVCN